MIHHELEQNLQKLNSKGQTILLILGEDIFIEDIPKRLLMNGKRNSRNNNYYNYS